MKMPEKPPIAARKPQQQRALHKVELMLEAAIRLLDKGGPEALTTNAVARVAGVSIGTLYQYFPNKEAILDALADRETEAVSQRILAALADPEVMNVRERVARIVAAVSASYGERRQVHRVIMLRSLAQGQARLAPLMAQLIGLLSSPDGPIEGQRAPFTRAEAFVLANAFLGVMRALILKSDAEPEAAEVEDALVRLMIAFAEPA